MFPLQQRFNASPGLVGPPMSYAHALDLAADGEIRNHVDSVKFSGAIVCGISLMSDSVMRLTEDVDGSWAEAADRSPVRKRRREGKEGENEAESPTRAAEATEPKIVDVKLPRKSLYIVTGDSRYRYGHAILGNQEPSPSPLLMTGKKGRRISVILRDELVPTPRA